MFDLIAELHIARKLPPLKGTTHVYKVDDHWICAVNGTSADVLIEPPNTMGCTVPPFHAALWFNGWLAGLFSPAGGAMAAGSLANEETARLAFTAAIAAESCPSVAPPPAPCAGA